VGDGSKVEEDNRLSGPYKVEVVVCILVLEHKSSSLGILAASMASA
jgi:hypothetical protein